MNAIVAGKLASNRRGARIPGLVVYVTEEMSDIVSDHVSGSDCVLLREKEAPGFLRMFDTLEKH